MYGYYTYTPINIEEILKRVSQEEIFTIVFKEGVDLDKKYTAPYRNDNEAGCWFHYFNDILYFTDFASSKINKNCFELLQKVYNKSFKDVLSLINDYFSLGLGITSNTTKEVKIELLNNLNKHNKNFKNKTPKKILCYLRPFDKRDYDFWIQYGITEKHLKFDKVYCIKGFSSTNRNDEIFTSFFKDIGYAYTDFNNNKIKIYRPYSKDFKWFTNCTNNDIGSINCVLNTDYIIITKSYKDCRVLRNLGYNSIWFQNEGQIPNKDLLIQILNKYKTIYIWFDNDTTGMGSVKIIRDELNKLGLNAIIEIILIPPILNKSHNVKDPSDYYKIFGREKLLEFIKSKINN